MYKEFIINILFPVQCLGCGTFDAWLCQSCYSTIEISNGREYAAGVRQTHLDQVWVVTSFQQPLLAQAIHHYKYNFIDSLGSVISQILIEFLARQIVLQPGLSFDVVLPMPLAYQRLRWRGYNQSAILASEVSNHFGWAYSDVLLGRTHQLLPQVGLNAQDRLAHVKNIFRVIDPTQIQNKNILIIDDVITTGATMNECAKVLRQNGACSVWGLAVARG